MFLNARRLMVAEDRGSAMAAVIGLLALTVIVTIAVAGASVASLTTTTSTRAGVQALAAADAGVDVVLAGFNQATPAFPCTSTATDAPRYTAAVMYRNAGGGLLSCPSGGVVSGTPRTAEIRSTGVADGPTIGATGAASRTVVAAVDLESVTITSGGNGANPLTKVMYAASTLSLSNGNSLRESEPGANDADVYTGNTLVCENDGSVIQGDVVAQDDAKFTNRCTVMGVVWARDEVSGDGAFFGDDVYSAGESDIKLRNGAHVRGTVIADGDIDVDGAGRLCPSGVVANICGSAVSVDNDIWLRNGSMIAGSAFAQEGIWLRDPKGTSIGANAFSLKANLDVSNANDRAALVGGWMQIHGRINPSYPAIAANSAESCQEAGRGPYAACGPKPTVFPSLTPAETFPDTLGYPFSATNDDIGDPAREAMPEIRRTAADLARWQQAGWRVDTVAGCAAGKSAIDTMSAATHSGKVLLVVDGCTSQLQWDSRTFSVFGDFAVMNDGGFRFYNGTNGIRSGTGAQHEVSLIVPTGASGTISTNSTTFTDVATFLYSAAKIEMQNSLTGFRGQIYARDITGPSSKSTLTMKQMSVPGVQVPGVPVGPPATSTTTWTVTVLSRLDEATG